MKLAAYVKNEVVNGRFPTVMIQTGEYGTFWLYDAEWKLLDCKVLTSREAAEKLRSKAIDAAVKRWAA